MSYQPPAHGFRTFFIVWATQSFSAFGSQLTFFAITVWLTLIRYPMPEQKPELAFALSAIALAFGVPAVFGSPIAGAWADRHDRKRTMMVADFISGMLSLTLMLLIVTQSLELWLLILVIVLASLLGSFHWSAFTTSYSMIVPEHQLARANGMMQTSESLANILAPGIAAILIALPALARQGMIPGTLGASLASLSDGTALAITIDAFTFFIAAATLIFLFIPSPKRVDLQVGKPKVSLWADVKEGAIYIWHRRPMLWLLGTFTVINFFGAPTFIFQPLLVKFNLASDWAARGYTFETALALVTTVFGLGGVAGGLLISTWGGLKSRRVYGVVVSMLIAGIAQVFFGLSPLLYLTAGAGFFRSAMSPIANAHSQAIWQAQTPHELQGRVFAVRRLIAQFTFPLGMILGGWAAGIFDVGWVTAALALAMILFLLAQLFNPYLLRVEDKAWLEELAARAENRQPIPAGK